MEPVQVVLTDQLAGLLAAAADITLRSDANKQLVELSDDERTDLQRLAVFMTAVASEPEKFPLRDSQAKSLRSKLRTARGPAQPQPRKASKPSQGRQKRTRAQKRAEAEAYNAARERVEVDMADREAYLEERRAQMENEPKFDITDIMGNTILAGVPSSMLVPVNEETHPTNPAGKIILPPSVEKALQGAG